MEFQDKTLICKDCGKEFTFTASEQQFYADKGFQNEPSRCADDRIKHRQERQDRPKTEVTCANCGKLTTVPFEPKGDRPVYCLDCFKQFKDEGKLPANPASTEAEPAKAEKAEVAQEEVSESSEKAEAETEAKEAEKPADSTEEDMS